MLNKEHVREDTSTQQMEAEREKDESCWKMITIRGPKRGTEGNMKLREKN